VSETATDVEGSFEGAEVIVNVRTRKWVRAGLVYLTVSFLLVGLWATLDPRGFYDGFPGGGRQWVAGDGPYNAHLAGDAGVGFLAVGVVLLLAAVWLDIRVIQAALIAAVVHDGPHLLYHLRHPNEALDSVDAALSNGGLFLGASLALVLLVATARAESRRSDSGGRSSVVNRFRSSDPQPHNGERKEVVRNGTA